MERAFRVLEAEILLTGPEAIVAPICRAYARFAVDADSLREPIRINADTDASEPLRVNDREVPIIPDLHPTVQVYREFLTEILGAIGSHAVLHAAALADRTGGAFLIAAPSGHGKSSLTLGLSHRGYRFLGDDYAPLNLETRCIHPYPRTLSILPGGTAPVPDAFVHAASRAGGIRLFGKVLVDVGEVLGEHTLCHDSLPLRNVFLLAGDAPANGTTVTVAAKSTIADRLDRGFREIDGVDVKDRSDSGPVTRWSLRLDHERHPTPALSTLLEHEDVLLSEKSWGGRPDFDRPPRVEPVKRRVAAGYLGRELLNRRSGSRLLERYEGAVAGLFLDVAGALSEAACWRIRPGHYEATLDLIEHTVCGDRLSRPV